MSSTHTPSRPGQLDVFKTPIWVTESIIHLLPAGRADEKLRVLEPCCGHSGEIIEVLRRNPNYRMYGIDISLPKEKDADGNKDAAGAAALKHLRSMATIREMDFLDHFPDMHYDLIVTNPPFNQAMEFIEHSLDILQPGGEAWFLLRLGFLASAGRNDWMRHHTPDTSVLPVRPSFYDGKPHHHGTGAKRRYCTRKRCCDSADYAWLMFENLHGRTSGVMRILPIPSEVLLDEDDETETEEAAEEVAVSEDELQPVGGARSDASYEGEGK